MNTDLLYIKLTYKNLIIILIRLINSESVNMMNKTTGNIFFEQVIFLPPEFFSSNLVYKSSIFAMSAFMAYFIEKDYFYDLTNSAFIEFSTEEYEMFIERTYKNKGFYQNGLNPEINYRVQEIISKVTSKSDNMTSLEMLPSVFNEKSNKLKLYYILRKISDFAREFQFYLGLVK